MFSKFIRLFLYICFFIVTTQSVIGQTLFVPFAQRGPTDVLARLIAANMGEDVVKSITNILGNGGKDGMAAMLNSNPEEGNLLLLNAQLFFGIVSADETILDKVEPIGLIALSPQVVVSSSSFSNWAAVLTNLKSGRLKVVYSGRYSPAAHCAEKLAQQTGGRLVELSGQALAVMSVISQEGVACVDATSAGPSISQSLIKIHATTISNSDLPLLNGVPTIDKIGITDTMLGNWQMLVSLRSMPEPLKITARNRLRKALGASDVQTKATNMGNSLVPPDLADSDLRAFVAREYKRIKSQ